MLQIIIVILINSLIVSSDDKALKSLFDNLDNVTFSFDCTNRSIGFYADIEYDCQIFHMCDHNGHRIPHLCANDTSFNQEYRICDWSYNFNCSEASKWYYLNDLTYATDPPIDDVSSTNNRNSSSV